MKAPDGSNWTVARSTEWTVRLALATSCAEACAESAASPARLDCIFEQFLTILCQLLMQLAVSQNMSLTAHSTPLAPAPPAGLPTARAGAGGLGVHTPGLGPAAPAVRAALCVAADGRTRPAAHRGGVHHQNGLIQLECSFSRTVFAGGAVAGDVWGGI